MVAIGFDAEPNQPACRNRLAAPKTIRGLVAFQGVGVGRHPFCCKFSGMRNPRTELRVSVVGDQIIVTWPELIYSVTYYKRESCSPNVSLITI